jgi:predicted PurR-regulated permease PerM
MKPQYFSALLFVAALYWIYQLYQPFLLSVTIASLLAMSTANLQRRLERLTRSSLIAALISTTLLALLFFAPLGYFLTAMTIKVNAIDPKSLEHFFDTLRNWFENAPELLRPLMPQIEQWLNGLNLNQLASNALSVAGSVGSYSASFLKTALLIIVFYFFAQYHGKRIFDFIKRVIQLPPQETTLLSFELTSVMGVVFYSIITTAMFEGALFGIAVAFMGYNGLLFGIMYGFASLIPVVGGMLMWLPFMLFEFSRGHTGGALFIAAYSIIVISIIADTFVKPWIIKQINLRVVKAEAKMNELLIFFAIIAGLASFGFWGMILGPAITAFFLSLLKLVEQRRTDTAESGVIS